jgi:hypothetical protein
MPRASVSNRSSDSSSRSHLLGVDGQVDVGRGRQVDQLLHAGHQHGKDTLALRLFVARKQRAELDRDAVGLHRPDAAVRPPAMCWIALR